jgi:NAD(P)-dependent dehydrogenase (short-subunit alcohol dehydrogenase family)
VSTVAGCQALAGKINDLENGKLDILVNNAGAAWGAPFEEFPENGWDKVMDLNVKSPFFLTQALHRRAEERRERRSAVESDQHRLDRRHPPQSVGDVFVSRVEVGLALSHHDAWRRG